MTSSPRRLPTRSLAAIGVGAVAMATFGAAFTGPAFAATDEHAVPARDAYIGVMRGISDSVSRDVAAYEKCTVTGPPFAAGDTACKNAPGTVVAMIDLQAAALDRLSNPKSKGYVGPPPADLAAQVEISKKAASDTYVPAASAMFSCRDYGCDATKYRSGLQAAKRYAAVLATWQTVSATSTRGPSASGTRVINGCEIKPGTKCPGVDLSGQDLSDANLTNADLTGANLTDTNFDGAQLSGAILNKVIATGAKFGEARMIGTKLNGAMLGYADFYRTQLGDAVLTGADLSHTNFDHAFMTRTVINRTTGSYQTFTGAQMVGADATGANLQLADFTSANMRGLDYSKNTNVSGAKFGGATCPNGSKAAGSPARCSEFGS